MKKIAIIERLENNGKKKPFNICLLYTSDAADD